jgi:phosphoribosylformylglycinamidine synthase subunit PurL
VACGGATPIGITNCLNFASPERPTGYWELAEAVSGMAEACVALGLPIVSGNVSLYNETPDGPILPTPVVGTVGLLDDRSRAIPMRWVDADEIWLLGEAAWDAGALAASELAWRRGRFGGEPTLDLLAAVRLVSLLLELGDGRLLTGAHDLSVGGLGVALARLAIASGVGATIALPAEAAALPSASLFGERGGRALVAVAPPNAAALAAAARGRGVPAVRLGVASGDQLGLTVGSARLTIGLPQLEEAWNTPFEGG